MDSLVQVALELCSFPLLPTRSEELSKAEGEPLLSVGEFSVLAHRVQADDKMPRFTQKVVTVNTGPLLLLRSERRAVQTGLLLQSALLLSELFNFCRLFLASLFDLEKVLGCSLQGLLAQTGVVDDRDGEVAPESGNRLEPHLVFSDHLGHINVLF